jgi:hypothetical protein
MSSGVYVDYMIGYCDTACDSLSEQMAAYWGESTMEGWNSKWTRIATDLGSDLTNITTDVNKLKAQIRMVDDAIKKL